MCWINEADPVAETPAINIEEANQERTVYLVSDEDGDGIDAAIYTCNQGKKSVVDGIEGLLCKSTLTYIQYPA